VTGQVERRLFPDRALLPAFYAGPRDPQNKADAVLVTDSPTELADGVELEVALGVGLPVYRLAGSGPRDAVVVGVEAAVFARLGLQVIRRVMIGTDWVLALPVVWHRGDHWLRVRYYHTSSHLGDEYQREIDTTAVSVNFARDALDGMAYLQVLPFAAVYTNVRWAYLVHPKGSGRWAARLGTQIGRTEGPGVVRPYGTVDVELDSDVDWEPRVTLQAGIWLPPIAGRRAVRVGVGFLTGPTPLAQFQGVRTTQISLGVAAHL
jgi:hypothetical protein